MASFLSSPTARNILRVVSGETVTKIIVFFSTLLLIRGLTQGDYDGYVTFQSARILFAGLVGGGVNLVMVRYGAELRSRTGRRPLGLYRMALLLQVGVYGVLLAVGFLFLNQLSQWVYGRLDHAWLVGGGLVAGAGYMLIQLFRGIYQAEERFNVFVIAFWVDTAMILTYLGILRLVNNLTLPWVIPGIAGIDIFVGAFLLWGSLGRSSPHDDLSLHSNTVTEVLRAAAWLIGYYAVLAILSQADVMMLGHYSNEIERACYGVALRYYMLALMSLGVINAVLLPKLSHADMQDPKNQVTFIRKWLRLSVLVALPLLVFDLVGRPVFTWLNGERYSAAFDVWIILSVGIWIGLMTSPLVSAVISRRYFRALFLLGACGLAASFICGYTLIPLWGGRGAAVATVVGNAVINLSSAFIVLRNRENQPEGSAAHEA